MESPLKTLHVYSTFSVRATPIRVSDPRRCLLLRPGLGDYRQQPAARGVYSVDESVLS